MRGHLLGLTALLDELTSNYLFASSSLIEIVVRSLGTEGRGTLSKKYEELYWKTDAYALDHLKDDDLNYYWRTMD